MTRQVWIASAITTLFIVLWSIPSARFSVVQGDFAAFYTGAQIARNGQLHSLHDTSLQHDLQKRSVPNRAGFTYFVRPHVYAAVLAPLALVPLNTAYLWFIGVQAAILLAVYVWAGRTFSPDAAVLASMFPISMFGPAFGQDVVLYLGIIVVSYHLYRRDRLFWSGAVLGLAVIKPHLALLVPVALLLQRRWRTLAGFIAGGAFAAVASLALAGFDGAALYLRFLHDQRSHLSPYPERMLNIDSLLLNAGIPSDTLRLLATLIALVLFFLACRDAEWWRGLAAAMSATLLVAPHTVAYDAVWMILPAWLAYYNSKSRMTRIAAICFFTPLAWLAQLGGQPWTAAPGLVLAFFLVAVASEAVAESRVAQSLSIDHIAETPNQDSIAPQIHQRT